MSAGGDPTGGVAAIDERSLGPVVGVALHAAHHVDADVAELLAIDDATRLREEDPYTDAWARAGDVCVVATRSRFEVDLNRPRERAMYRGPADAWGLAVWRVEPPADVLERARVRHDRFYGELRAVLDRVAARHGRFVVLDVHSYNHRRGGPRAPFDDPADNPEVNVGTSNMDRGLWAPVVECFMAALADESFSGRRLDVRENVRFQGGYLVRWVHANYPGAGCALALEVKKLYMDEWTGRADPAAVAEIGGVLARAAGAVRACLGDGRRVFQ